MTMNHKKTDAMSAVIVIVAAIMFCYLISGCTLPRSAQDASKTNIPIEGTAGTVDAVSELNNLYQNKSVSYDWIEGKTRKTVTYHHPDGGRTIVITVDKLVKDITTIEAK